MHSAPLELEPQGEAGNTDYWGKVKKTQPKLKEQEKELETDDEIVEESFGRPEQVNEEVSASLAPNAFRDGKQMVEIHNDLQAAIEVDHGRGWRVLYPQGRLRFETSSPLDVAARLRDDQDICGSCRVLGAALLKVSVAFADFGQAAVKFIEAEQEQVERESRLREARLQKLRQDFSERGRARCKALVYVLPMSILFQYGTTFAFLYVLETRTDPYLTPPLITASLITATVGEGVISLVLNCGVVWPNLSSSLDDAAVQAKRFGADTRTATFLPRFCTVVVAACPLLMILYSFMKGELSAALAGLLLFMLNSWPVCCIDICRMKKADLKALDEWSDKYIVFEGRVLPYRPWPGCPPCVCSWPGKYESAWDVLVESSSEGGISAAVVFLPEGSQHYGCHDPIPLEEELEGDCWCIPLYGEKKQWGCRWWTRWVANIEEAVRQGAELNVFFFDKKLGQGRVQSFATAGQENLRRESIWRRKDEFESSADYQNALAAGLEKLSKCKSGDSSSQYTREWQRLFFAWLPQEDREFLEASEGLGNSQKAEVAWLERKGYAYTSVEIDVAKWTQHKVVSNPSPKVIGGASLAP